MANFFKILKNKLFGAFKKSESKKEKSFSLSKDSVNFVSLKGTVLSCLHNGKATVIYLRAMDKHKNTPKIIFFGSVMNTAATFLMGDDVSIEGYIQSEKLNESNRGQETFYVVGTSIKPLGEETANCPNIVYKSNCIKVRGKVVDVFDMGDIVKINIKTMVKGYFNFVPVDYYVYNNNALPKLEFGDIIDTSGYIQTTDKMLNDKQVHFQNFVVRKVELLHKADKVEIVD